MPDTTTENFGNLTASLATFVSETSRRGVPDEVRAVLQAAVLDAIGCGLFGLTTAGRANRARLCAGTRRTGGSDIVGIRRPAHLRRQRRIACRHRYSWFRLRRSSPRQTSFERGGFARRHWLWPSARKPAAPLYWRHWRRAMKPWLASALLPIPTPPRMRSWHLTGTCGTFGAAAAASVILGFDVATTASALGLAGTQSSGLWAFNADGAMSKRLHPGHSAQNGITAALLAQKGFHGPRHILEAEDGGFLAAMSDQTRPGEITRDLGDVWRAAEVCFKPYSCCGSNHASIDAALDLKAEHRFTAADVRSVTIGIARVVERQTGFPYVPSTVLNAQMSIRQNVAVALLDSKCPHRTIHPGAYCGPGAQ